MFDNISCLEISNKFPQINSLTHHTDSRWDGTDTNRQTHTFCLISFLVSVCLFNVWSEATFILNRDLNHNVTETWFMFLNSTEKTQTTNEINRLQMYHCELWKWFHDHCSFDCFVFALNFLWIQSLAYKTLTCVLHINSLENIRSFDSVRRKILNAKHLFKYPQTSWTLLFQYAKFTSFYFRLP